VVDRVERSYDRLPITKTFRSLRSFYVNGIRLKDADFLSLGAFCGGAFWSCLWFCPMAAAR
jgi:hypothetical protein